MDKFPNRNIFVLNTMKNINDNERLKSNKKLMKKNSRNFGEQEKKSTKDLRSPTSFINRLQFTIVIDH